MIIRLSKLVAIGILSLWLVSHTADSSESANLEGQEMNKAQMEIITMEDVDAMIEEEELNVVLNSKGGLHKLVIHAGMAVKKIRPYIFWYVHAEWKLFQPLRDMNTYTMSFHIIGTLLGQGLNQCVCGLKNLCLFAAWCCLKP